ncbi:Diaminopimelate epimerase [Ochromonadaceae sp. CCMP2298]|nr:Diaminopimelate epimerase [Ochromonadaceae sp. CCMP2298]|mmetsp:Transcript_14867/g.32808  ORF Transcript_14867/g.32808 Transcript_14867/m.32808 type:complete len:329 (-) Transcript_14867:221-1207(-)
MFACGLCTTLVASLCLQLVSGLLGAGFSRNTRSMSSALNAWTGGKDAFVKYQGLGNDFILVDNRGSNEPIYTPAQAVKLCDRNFGIGGDGLIFALPGEKGCDYTMRIYNSDGTEPQMCGNGIRCMAKFLQLIESNNNAEIVYKIWTNAGVIVPKITADGLIAVDMGEPVLQAEKVPTRLSATLDGAAVESPITVAGKEYKATAVSMGNPHSVIFVDNLETMDPSFSTVGPLVERHVDFPEKVNAEFVQVVDRSHVIMKVWERGAGATLACGTGACAVVVAGVLSGRTERQCTVTLPGGDLEIFWAEDNKVYMTGPAKEVFSGTLDPTI